jgi:hypothetical protein
MEWAGSGAALLPAPGANGSKGARIVRLRKQRVVCASSSAGGGAGAGAEGAGVQRDKDPLHEMQLDLLMARNKARPAPPLEPFRPAPPLEPLEPISMSLEPFAPISMSLEPVAPPRELPQRGGALTRGAPPTRARQAQMPRAQRGAGARPGASAGADGAPRRGPRSPHARGAGARRTGALNGSKGVLNGSKGGARTREEILGEYQAFREGALDAGPPRNDEGAAASGLPRGGGGAGAGAARRGAAAADAAWSAEHAPRGRRTASAGARGAARGAQRSGAGDLDDWSDGE